LELISGLEPVEAGLHKALGDLPPVEYEELNIRRDKPNAVRHLTKPPDERDG
jgi:hypothetical protein